MRTRPLALLLLAAAAVIPAIEARAQQDGPTVYLESKDEFANDFAAGVIRKKVPVTLTGDRGQAGYVARFTWATNQGSKTQGVMTALMVGVYMNGAYERVSMSITERKSKNLVYSYTCQKGGRRTQSVAECLAKHWKGALESGKIKMRGFKAGDLEGIEDSQAETVSVRRDSDISPAKIIEHAAAEPKPESATPGTSTVLDPPRSMSLGEIAREERAKKEAAAAASR